MISERQAESLVIHFDHIGTLIIGASLISSTGITLGGLPMQAQLFNPWPGVLLISLAFSIKLALHHGELNHETSLLKKSDQKSGDTDMEIAPQTDTEAPSPATTEISNESEARCNELERLSKSGEEA